MDAQVDISGRITSSGLSTSRKVSVENTSRSDVVDPSVEMTPARHGKIKQGRLMSQTVGAHIHKTLAGEAKEVDGTALAAAIVQDNSAPSAHLESSIGHWAWTRPLGWAGVRKPYILSINSMAPA